MMDALVNKFNQQALKHQEGQTLNPFSDRFNRSPSPRPKFSKEEYGKPVAGSKTDIRGQKAFSHINREILELCECIHDIGHHRQDPDDGSPQVLVPFGELFAVYSRISDKVSGLLIAAKKRGYVYFEPEILFQRRDDDEIVALVMPMSEIKAHVKGLTSPAPSAAATPSAESTSSAPANTLEAKDVPKRKSKSPSPKPSKAVTTSEAVESEKVVEEKKEEVSKPSAPEAPSVEVPTTDNQTNDKVAAEPKSSEEIASSVSSGALVGSQTPGEKLPSGEPEKSLESVNTAPVLEAPTSVETTESTKPTEDTTSTTPAETPSNEEVVTVVTTPVEDVSPTAVIVSETPSSTEQPAETPSNPELSADTSSTPASLEEIIPIEQIEELEKPTEELKSTPLPETKTSEETSLLSNPLEDLGQTPSTEEASSDDALTLVMYVPVEEAPLPTKALEIGLTPSAEAPSSDKGEQTLA